MSCLLQLLTFGQHGCSCANRCFTRCCCQRKQPGSAGRPTPDTRAASHGRRESQAVGADQGRGWGQRLSQLDSRALSRFIAGKRGVLGCPLPGPGCRGTEPEQAGPSRSCWGRARIPRRSPSGSEQPRCSAIDGFSSAFQASSPQGLGRSFTQAAGRWSLESTSNATERICGISWLRLEVQHGANF